MKPVIKKALVELEGEPFKCFISQREDWARYDLYRNPGPLQFVDDDNAVELSITLTLELNKEDPRMHKAALEAAKRVQDDFTVSRSGKFILCPNPVDRLSLVQLARAAAASPQCPLNITKKSTPATSNFGVLFCGRQAPGGHDIIAGLYDYVHSVGGRLFGFVAGTQGLLSGNHLEICESVIKYYRGQGGFDIIGRKADDLEGEDVFEKAVLSAKSLGVSTLVLIGSVITCTNAAYFAEYCEKVGAALNIIVAPADINCGLKNRGVLDVTVGFDTVTKVCGQIVGNNATDGASAKKYYYFMRVMGYRSSHSTLEVALLTKPNYAILCEEVIEFQMTLADIVSSISDVIVARAAAGKNYGTVLIPEGLILAIPEMKGLIQSIDLAHANLKESGEQVTLESISSQLPAWNKALLESLPAFIVSELLLERCTDGSLQCAQVETERLLAVFVEEDLNKRKKAGTYKGSTSVVNQFLGYQARGSIPTVFDSVLGYNTGRCAGALGMNGHSGCIAAINNVTQPVSAWEAKAIPLKPLLSAPPNALKLTTAKPVFKTSIVDLAGPAYLAFAAQRASWALADEYENPGPIQLQGPVSCGYCKSLVTV